MDVISANYGEVFANWRAACPTQWQQYTRHTFVEKIADGSLPESAFIGYLRQDYVYLINYSRAWALAIAKAGNLAEMQAAGHIVNNLINREMQLHVDVCAAAGISEKDLENTQELPQNIAYTRYVLEAGYTGDFLDLMAALAPCVLGYGEIGLHLQQSRTSPRYQNWMDAYADAGFQAHCANLGALFDSAVKTRLGDEYQSLGRWQSLTKHFATATELERDFWSMALAL